MYGPHKEYENALRCEFVKLSQWVRLSIYYYMVQLFNMTPNISETWLFISIRIIQKTSVLIWWPYTDCMTWNSLHSVQIVSTYRTHTGATFWIRMLVTHTDGTFSHNMSRLVKSIEVLSISALQISDYSTKSKSVQKYCHVIECD
jgi:hypothetical protein